MFKITEEAEPNQIMIMKTKLLISLAAVLSLIFASCAAGPNTQAGALTGAAIGGVAGAIIGNNVGDGDAGRGALIGAAVGGAAGAAAGNAKDKQQGHVRRGY